MKITLLLAVLCTMATMASANLVKGYFTPLSNHEHPCAAENLKESHRYICDKDANVICLSGWTEPHHHSDRDPNLPCPIPVCDYNDQTCVHGDCVRPDVCACEVGWTGHICDICIPLPGCHKGSCEEAFECNCDTDLYGVEQYQGAFCDTPACNETCEHGKCWEPFVCTCKDGFSGPNCDICEKLPGCVNGQCIDDEHPHTCYCDNNWTGHFCDVPECSKGCDLDHGFCETPYTCLCKPGYMGHNCDECKTYWNCPKRGTCNKPNQCICNLHNGTYSVTDNGNCNRVSINGPRYGPPGDCSNPCQRNDHFDKVLNITGERISECKWDDSGSCSDLVEPCHGDKEWITRRKGKTDASRCIYVRGPSTTNGGDGDGDNNTTESLDTTPPTTPQ